MTRITTLVLTTWLAVAPWTSSGAAEIDRSAAAVAGMEATFTQRFTPKGFKTAQVESGSVIFGTLPMMRWTYSSPEQKIFVFDGTQSWFYVPGDRQVTIGRIDETRKKELPFLLLGDSAARDRSFSVREQTRSGSVVTTLQPRDNASLIRSVTVTSSATDHVIQRVEYSDRQGNRTVFELTGYHPRPSSADTFRFTPPAGVQVVNAD